MGGQRELEARKEWTKMGWEAEKRGGSLDGSRGQKKVEAETGWEAGGK